MEMANVSLLNKECINKWLCRLKESELTEQDEELLNDIQEKVYSEVYNITNHDDMAAYISEDFALICESELLGYKDSWLTKLIECYQNAQFPF